MCYKILILVGRWEVLAHAKLTAIVPGHFHVIAWSNHEIKADCFIYYYYFNGKLLFIEAIIILFFLIQSIPIDKIKPQPTLWSQFPFNLIFKEMVHLKMNILGLGISLSPQKTHKNNCKKILFLLEKVQRANRFMKETLIKFIIWN